MVLALVITVLSVAIMLSVGVGILSGASEAQDCSTLPGAGTPAGGTCTITPASTTPVTWSQQSFTRTAPLGSRTAADNAYAAQINTLTSSGYTRLTNSAQCGQGFVGGFPVTQSNPVIGHREELSFCANYEDGGSGGGTRYYYIGWNVRSGGVTTPAVNGTCPAVATAPGSWAAVCEQAEQQTQTAYALIALTVVIAAAVVAIVAVRMLGVGL